MASVLYHRVSETLNNSAKQEIAASISIAEIRALRAKKDFYRSDKRNASGWCNQLKAVHHFNLTVIWSRLFHILFNRAVEKHRPHRGWNES